MSNLNKLRKEIENIDYEIMNLIYKRCQLGGKVIEIKIKNGNHIRNSKQEKIVLNRALKYSKVRNINSSIMKNIFKYIIKINIAYQLEILKTKTSNK